MAIVFDPATQIITLDTLSVSTSQLWSRWVDWVATSDNAKYLPAFSQLGGVAPVALYITLENGWKVRPMEAAGQTTVTGNLLVAGGGSPFVATVGTFASQVVLEAPLSAQAIAVGSGLSTTEQTQLQSVYDITGGGGKQVGTQLICYAADNVTEVARFDLYDASGTLTSDMSAVVEQRRV